MSDRNAAIFVELVDGPIDLSALQAGLADPDVGAHGWFYGVTRRQTQVAGAVAVTAELAYQAHREMAIAELRSLADQTWQRFKLQRLVVSHRLGVVPIGEASVVVGASSAHRANVFAALPWLMDRLKQDVPIWKQETYDDGTTAWVHPIEPTRSDPASAHHVEAVVREHRSTDE